MLAAYLQPILSLVTHDMAARQGTESIHAVVIVPAKLHNPILRSKVITALAAYLKLVLSAVHEAIHTNQITSTLEVFYDLASQILRLNSHRIRPIIQLHDVTEGRSILGHPNHLTHLTIKLCFLDQADNANSCASCHVVWHGHC